MPDPHDHPRRNVLHGSALRLDATAAPWAGGPARAQPAPALVVPERARPQVTHGLQFGDVTPGRAIVWSRCDRPARMLVEYATRGDFRDARRVLGPCALESTDYTARVDLTGLPADAELFVRVRFERLDHARAPGDAVGGHLRTAPRGPRPLRLLWSGDTAGQGCDVDPERGGMRLYDTMRRRRPDLFIHCGGAVHADGPLPVGQLVEHGRVWRKRVTPEVAGADAALDAFRGRYRDRLQDAALRRFNAEVAQVWLWDDRGPVNASADAGRLEADPHDAERRVPLLAARAFLEYAPLRRLYDEAASRVYRHLPHGPLLDLFVVDPRGHHGPDPRRRPPAADAAGAFHGRPQLGWLLDGLRHSRATWKLIAIAGPSGLAMADDDAPALTGLLRGLRAAGVKNVVWLSTGVHATAAHRYDPACAAFTDVDPFRAFFPGPLDAAFGPRVAFQKVPETPNASPCAGLQCFGEVDIDAATRTLAVELRDIDDRVLFRQSLAPA